MLIGLRVVCGVVLSGLAALSADQVLLITEGQIGGPASHGLAKLEESLTSKGFTVQRGTAARAPGANFVVRASQGGATRAPQSFAIERSMVQGKPAVLLSGADPVGLMYAALDTAERVSLMGSGRDPFAGVRDTRESPYLPERGISMYTMQRAYFESRLYDDNHWKSYFDLLASSRINTFTIIFGYENGGFMAPLYPYFFELPQHPDVRLVGITRAQQERNVAALKRVIQIAHERGIQVIPAVWDHIYRGGVQGGGIPGASELAGKDVAGLVSGVTAENLAAYTKDALRRFFEVFPGVDGIEFRMHGESGLKRDEMGPFWHEVFGILAKAKPGLLVTLRAKELPDAIIEDARSQGLNARIETKYWMEQMGLPYHPTHVNKQNQHDRRHGYADLLKYPQSYRVHWRLWSGGTTRLLLWADPDYVRRYAASARVYDGNSIDVNEMLATWMLGEPHEKAPMPVLNAKYKYYEYPFERYWHFYEVWGRVSYNPDAPPRDLWLKKFERRFGAAGSSLMSGLHAASGILPRIVASSYRYQLFPTTRGWAEMMRQDNLPRFADLEGTDIEQFMNPRDAARSLVSGTATSKRRPEETSRWFANTADTVLKHVRAAESAGASGSEAASTLADLKILAWLARYYAARLPAAVTYNIFRETSNTRALEQAIEHEKSAVAAWAEIVKAAGDIYAPELPFGVHRAGFPRHWKEELEKLQQGLKQLEAEKPAGGSATPAPALRQGSGDPKPPTLRLEPSRYARPGQDLPVSVRAEDPSRVKSLRLRYRHLTQYEDYETAEMSLNAATGMYTAIIPGRFVIPQWDLMYFVEAIDSNGNGRNYPDLDVEAPYVIVRVQR